MNISEFQAIIDSQTPRVIQRRLVSLDEATAVIGSYHRLTEPFQSRYLSLPVGKLIEFALMPTKKANGSGFKTYVQTVETTETAPPSASEFDYPDIEPPKIVESVKKRVKPPVREVRDPTQTPLYKRLLERIDALEAVKPQPVSVTVETSEAHIERLVEIEQSMAATLTLMTERVDHMASQSASAQLDLTEVIDGQRSTMQQLVAAQSRLVESQAAIITALGALSEKVAVIAQTPPQVSPVVNLPAPIVNITTESGRRVTTKRIERDANGLIAKVTEDVGDDD